MKISIVAPVYNAEKFLNRSIESVLNQTYQNLELILINDGSTDGSENICRCYELADKRIKLISQKNKGPAAARNAGIRHATGDFVLFLDADDFIGKDTIETLITKYYQHRSDLVMANFCKLENNGEIIKQGVTFHPDEKPFTQENKVLSKTDIVSFVRHFLKHPSNHLISYCWGRLYKLSIIKNNSILAKEDMRLFEDFIFNLDYLRHTNEILFVNEAMYTYAMHNNHISASMAIVNADSLLHDMDVFRAKGSEFLQLTYGGIMNNYDIRKEIGHALIHYVIIFLIRSCRQITINNRGMIYKEINKIVNAPILRDSLQYYSPSKGNSRIVPLLMKLKRINLLMDICKEKAFKRYGKPSE